MTNILLNVGEEIVEFLGRRAHKLQQHFCSRRGCGSPFNDEHISANHLKSNYALITTPRSLEMAMDGACFFVIRPDPTRKLVHDRVLFWVSHFRPDQKTSLSALP